MKRVVLALALLALNVVHATKQESVDISPVRLETLYDMPSTSTSIVYVPLWAITPGQTSSIYQRSLLIGLLTLAGAATSIFLDTDDIIGLLSHVTSTLSDLFYFEQFGIKSTCDTDRDLLIDLVSAYAQKQGLILLNQESKDKEKFTPPLNPRGGQS